MKTKLFTLALPLALCLTLLAGCGDAASSSSESGGSSSAANTSSQVITISSENTPVSSEQAPVSSEQTLVSSESEPQSTESYLTADPDKSDAYNKALAAYNDFLCGKIAAKNESNKPFYVTDLMTITYESGIGFFLLYDVNGDKIPELHTRGLTHRVLSYVENEIVTWYDTMDRVDILENGAIMPYHWSHGDTYQVITFAADGTTSVISFENADYVDDGYTRFFFDDREVTKEKWDELTKEYFDSVVEPERQYWDGVRE